MYLLFQVSQTDISIAFHFDNLNLVASHLSTGRICTMSRYRNKAHLEKIGNKMDSVTQVIYSTTNPDKLGKWSKQLYSNMN